MNLIATSGWGWELSVHTHKYNGILKHYACFASKDFEKCFADGNSQTMHVTHMSHKTHKHI